MTERTEIRKLAGLEIATTQQGRDITRGYIDALPWLPPTDRVLPLAGGWRGYEELLRDDQVAAVFGQRRLAVVSRPWTVEPGGERRIDRAAAELIRRTLTAIDWDQITDQMLYARFFGYAVGEVLWTAGRDGIGVEALKVRDRARFAFAPDAALLLRTTQQPAGERLPARKFWVVSVGASHADEPYGRGLAHALYWPVWFKRQGARFWATYLEKFGAPTAIGTFPSGTDDAARTKLLDAVEAIQTEAGLVIPEGMKIELLEASRGGTASYEQWMGHWDRAIAKIVLGQTMTTENGSSRSQAEVHFGVRQEIVKADADLVCASANRTWVRWLIDAALPGAAYPQIWRDMSDAEDLDRRADRDLKLSQIGYRLDPATVQEVYGPGYVATAPPPQSPVEGAARGPQPPVEAPAETLTAAERDARGLGPRHCEPQAKQSPAGDRHGAARLAMTGHGAARLAMTGSVGCPVHGVIHAREGADAPPDAALADRLEIETGPAWAAIMDRVREIVAQAESLPALRDALLGAFGELPTERLADVMAMGFAAADLAGRYAVAGDGDRG